MRRWGPEIWRGQASVHEELPKFGLRELRAFRRTSKRGVEGGYLPGRPINAKNNGHYTAYALYFGILVNCFGHIGGPSRAIWQALLNK